ncbi:MAG TPA: adenylosuccinate synthetase, partial [Candidatus Fermentibacter sp.]|nr:adenylosuccinate synthetase [Candidatus Fermentibacter sp.]
MPLRIVVGLGWGDEGKGKVVDHLAPGSGAVARFSGGANAGHTVKTDGGSVVLHQVPSGMLRPGIAGFIGAGCVLDPVAMLAEMEALSDAGHAVRGRLRVSGSAHLVHPVYRLVEAEEELRRGSRAIGTTGRGIGPAYVRKFGRTGIRLEDAADRSALESMSDALLEEAAGMPGSGPDL